MKLLDNLKALFKAKSIFDAVKKLHGEGFDFKVALAKMGRRFLWAALGVVLLHLMDPTSIANYLGVLPENLQKALTPFAIAGLGAAWSWYQNKDNEIMLVAPVVVAQPGEKRQGPQVVPGAAPIAISVHPAVPPAITPTIPKDVGA